ncbi:MAG TPA: 1-deoxy-D-xylulose-5-phosphate reductoisomerase [Stellaceae bacterium]|nr:1-deoxy-D-xylulose-5-phosphate reductoisomerase [Stellaceae bacterium]
MGEKRQRRRVTVLGSTGSVGRNTIDLIERQTEDFSVEALTAHRNVEVLSAQARRLKARLAVVGDPTRYAELKRALAGSGIEVAAGAEAVAEAAARPADWVMAAIVGAAGLVPTLEAVRRGAIVALANKEVLVCAGELFMAEVRRHGATLLPVDSEHNAIFQVFDNDRVGAIDRIVLTGSGGPFRELAFDAMGHVTPEQAIAHPNWRMGPKISVDSATMMNKGLELIEAHHLFGLPEPQLDILINHQSIVHGMVVYRDGSVLAQLGAPDMRTPIAHTLAWPERMAAPTPRLDLAALGRLTFAAPDETRFPALRLARAALRRGGASPTILNAANEIAVHAFLERAIGFLDIARVVEGTLERLRDGVIASLEDVHNFDTEARQLAGGLIGRERRARAI